MKFCHRNLRYTRRTDQPKNTIIRSPWFFFLSFFLLDEIRRRAGSCSTQALRGCRRASRILKRICPRPSVRPRRGSGRPPLSPASIPEAIAKPQEERTPCLCSGAGRWTGKVALGFFFFKEEMENSLCQSFAKKGGRRLMWCPFLSQQGTAARALSSFIAVERHPRRLPELARPLSLYMF